MSENDTREHREQEIAAKGRPEPVRLNHDDWHTPMWLCKLAWDVFEDHPDLDPATSPAAEMRAQRELYEGGLDADWSEYESIWLNPPYSKPKPWLVKLDDWARSDPGIKGSELHGPRRCALALIKADPSTSVWRDVIWSGEEGGPDVFFLRRRVRFGGPLSQGKRDSGPTFASAIVVYGPEIFKLRARKVLHAGLAQCCTARLAWPAPGGWTWPG
jgi:hypothetical protein